MVKVSVIVPIYNAEKYLKQCLDSIVNQTLKDIQIILINDGSTDRSDEICKQYLSDERVIYYKKENEGLAAARADGIERAQGEYIGFVDSDDWMELDAYEKMYNAAQLNHADIVFCNCIENEDGHRFTPEMRSGSFNREQIINEILPKTLAFISKQGGKRAIRWSNCLRIYRANHLHENEIEFDRRFRRSQDLQFTYEATLCAQNYYYLGDEYLYHNRVTTDSLSRGYTKNMWSLYKILIERLYEVTEKYEELNLTEQMHLRTFFFVTDCIENELKESCPNNKNQKIQIIKEIMEDEICEHFHGKISINEMNEFYQRLYEYIERKTPEKVLSFAKRYQRKQNRKKRVWNPLIHCITEGPVLGKIYKMVRRR